MIMSHRRVIWGLGQGWAKPSSDALDATGYYKRSSTSYIFVSIISIISNRHIQNRSYDL